MFTFSRSFLCPVKTVTNELPLSLRESRVTLFYSFLMMSEDKTVKCCGSNLKFHVSDVKYSLHRNWIKTKKIKTKLFDADR